MRLYRPDGSGSIAVPDIDAAGWISLHGMLTQPPSNTPPAAAANAALAPAATDEPTPMPLGDAVLALINSASYAYELKPIPTVGESAAQVIIDERPADGYPDLDSLPKEIFNRPFRANLSKVKGWGGVVDGDSA